MSPIYRPSSFCDAFIRSRFALATARFSACIFDLSSRRHLSTEALRSLHPPEALCIKPLEWHSSRVAMISSHAGNNWLEGKVASGQIYVPSAFFVCKWGCILGYGQRLKEGRGCQWAVLEAQTALKSLDQSGFRGPHLNSTHLDLGNNIMITPATRAD